MTSTISLKYAPVGLHWAGPDGTILRVNAAELKMLGYHAPRVFGA